VATSTLLEHLKERDTDQDLPKLEKGALLQDSILLLSPPLKSDAQKHQRLGRQNRSPRSSCSQLCAAEDSTAARPVCSRTPAQLRGLPLVLRRGTPPATCSARNETQEEPKHGQSKEQKGPAAGKAAAGKRRGQGTAARRGVLAPCNGVTHLTSYLHALK